MVSLIQTFFWETFFLLYSKELIFFEKIIFPAKINMPQIIMFFKISCCVFLCKNVAFFCRKKEETTSTDFMTSKILILKKMQINKMLQKYKNYLQLVHLVLFFCFKFLTKYYTFCYLIKYNHECSFCIF